MVFVTSNKTYSIKGKTMASKKDRELAFWAGELTAKRVTQAQYDAIIASLQTVSSGNSEVWDQAAYGLKPKAKGKCSYKGFEYFDMPRDKRNEKSENGLLIFECFYDKQSVCRVACDIDFNGLYYQIEGKWVLVGYASKGLFTRENPNDFIGKPLDPEKYLATYQCLYDIMLSFRNGDKKVTERRLDPAIAAILAKKPETETKPEQPKAETSKRGKK